MSTPSPEQRAAWIAGMRKVLDILEADPGLNLPEGGPEGTVRFSVPGPMARRQVAALEAAFPVQFTAHVPDPDNSYPDYVLEGGLDGITVRIKGFARDLAERVVTGTRTVEDVKWVRLVEDENPENGAKA